MGMSLWNIALYAYIDLDDSKGKLELLVYFYLEGNYALKGRTNNFEDEKIYCNISYCDDIR